MKQAVSIFDIITQSIKAQEEVPSEVRTDRTARRVETRLPKNWDVVDQTSVSVCVRVCAGMFACLLQ